MQVSTRTRTPWRKFLRVLGIAPLMAILVGTRAGGMQDRAEARIEALIAQMTLEEKVEMLGGNQFETKPIARLGIPPLKMADGPLGVRIGQATAFPAGIAMGATFNPALLREVGVAIADETRFKGRHMLLGPAVNLSRHPFGGRNFESYGEDPYLSGQLAAEYVRGIQSRNVLASVKHFAVNDQEHERLTIDVRVSPRALFEVHLPAFKAAVDAGSWTVMSAYNKINGHYASENDYLLNKVLKGMWNFQGFVVSDWESTHSTIAAANHGLDLEMPIGLHFNEKLVKAVRDGQVKEAVVNDKVRRILRAMYAIGLIDPAETPRISPPRGPNTPEHNALARQVSRESIVMLKNEHNVLPLKRDKIKKIAVIGPNANWIRNGGGSSEVDPPYKISLLQALRARYGQSITVNYEAGVLLPGDNDPIPTQYLRAEQSGDTPGLKAEYYVGRELQGTPFLTRIDSHIDFAYDKGEDTRLRQNFSVRWTGFMTVPQTGRYQITTFSDDGVRLFLDNREVISAWSEHSTQADSVDLELVAGEWYPIRMEYFQGAGAGRIALGWQALNATRLDRAVELAKNADAAVVVGGLSYHFEGEAHDRKTMDLPEGQDELIQAIAAANPNTVVVLYSGNPMKMSPWVGKVKGLLQAWYPGQEGGNALADILMGEADPSGRLPVTFLKRWEDSPAYGNYPGENGKVEYREGIFIGYRHFDKNAIAPEFPFGFGLSYANFAYRDLRVQKLGELKYRVEFTVQNVGKVAGTEVPQLYVGELLPRVERPPKELKGFAKIHLAPGESKTVTLDLASDAFAHFEESSLTWKADPGSYQILVGASSRDIRLQTEVSLGRK